MTSLQQREKVRDDSHHETAWDTETSLAQSHALCVAAPGQVINFVEFNQHSRVTTKNLRAVDAQLRRYWLSWDISLLLNKR